MPISPTVALWCTTSPAMRHCASAKRSAWVSTVRPRVCSRPMGAPSVAEAGTIQAGAIGESRAANALFVLPYLLILVVLLVVPLGLGIWLAFQDYDMLSGWN